jgi:ADP-heptose:LPS heptosyltransferase
MYTHVIPRPDGLRPRHAVANQWDLLEPLGVGACDPARDAVEMAHDPGAAARLDRRLVQAGIGPSHRLIVVHVSAGNPFRRWPAEAFAALILELARRDQARRFMIVSGPSDADGARGVAEQVGQRLGGSASPAVYGEFDLQELRALVTRAAVYIGGDTGPLHIAATTETPIVAVLGPTLAERSMPWRNPRWHTEAVDAGALPCRPCHQRTCVPGDFRCLTGITPERVAAAAERALASMETTSTRVLHA